MIKSISDILKSIAGFRRRQPEKELSLNSVFRHFRDILNSNDSALTIMADMGDKLSGDYLFDINYVRNAYSGLSDALNNSIRYFAALTGNKYSKLQDAFTRIDNRIKRMIYGEGISSGAPLIVFYDDITWDIRQIVGGKNANLAEVKNYLKLNAPEGFVITTAAYDEFMRYNRLDAQIGKLAIGDISQAGLIELKRLIRNGDMPPALGIAIESAIQRLKREGYNSRCAVRSSAEEEDSEASFAGQFETILNVPLKKDDVEDAYKRVISSLFSERAIAYQRKFGFELGRLKMAAGCIAMVDAKSSGVIYTEYSTRIKDSLVSGVLINATWGLGKSVVEGQVDADQYILSKEAEPDLIEKRIGRKETMIVSLKEGWIKEIYTPQDLRDKPCLTDDEMAELVMDALLIERHFGRPQDIEWAIDEDGRIFILQSRPLRILEKQGQGARVKGQEDSELKLATVLIKNKGIVVQKGISAGRVFILRHMDELDRFPKGAVLVAGHDSSEFVRIMPYASAIITDVGSPTSHMTSLSREFRIPTIVNTGDATRILRHGQEVTIDADDDSIAIYEGKRKEFLETAGAGKRMLEDIYEFRKKRYILRHITPLNLTDPLREDFIPEGCKTVHDILRFIHEKSIEELIVQAGRGIKGRKPVRLNLPIPAGITVVDIGGGLMIKEGQRVANFEDIASVPLRAIIKGMTHPGVWHSDMVPLTMKDFMAGMMRAPEITTDTSTESHVAIASGEYVNLNLRFGYHMNILDCYCSENQRNNHIYFRFIGGATDITKRTRRIKLIADILKEFGFNIKTEGDLIISRLANIRQDEMKVILDQIGRLIAYTRQMDAMLRDNDTAERYARSFMEEKYEL